VLLSVQLSSRPQLASSCSIPLPGLVPSEQQQLAMRYCAAGLMDGWMGAELEIVLCP
jgi:hypothetical protein